MWIFYTKTYRIILGIACLLWYWGSMEVKEIVRQKKAIQAQEQLQKGK